MTNVPAYMHFLKVSLSELHYRPGLSLYPRLVNFNTNCVISTRFHATLDCKGCSGSSNSWRCKVCKYETYFLHSLLVVVFMVNETQRNNIPWRRILQLVWDRDKPVSRYKLYRYRMRNLTPKLKRNGQIGNYSKLLYSSILYLEWWERLYIPRVCWMINQRCGHQISVVTCFSNFEYRCPPLDTL